MWTRAELKERAKTAFTSNYWWCVLAALIMLVVTGGLPNFSFNFNVNNVNNSSSSTKIESTEEIGVSVASILLFVLLFIVIFTIIFVIAFVISTAISTFLLNIVEVGACRFFTQNAAAPVNVTEFLYGFKNSYMNIVKVMFFRYIYIWLWSLLFIIPGIIKSYEYRMIPYLLAENPDMTAEEAFRISKEMMYGNKWDAFVLDLSFIGWNLLSLPTCGILLIFYVNPYRYATNAELYLELKGRNLN